MNIRVAAIQKKEGNLDIHTTLKPDAFRQGGSKSLLGAREVHKVESFCYMTV